MSNLESKIIISKGFEESEKCWTDFYTKTGLMVLDLKKSPKQSEIEILPAKSTILGQISLSWQYWEARDRGALQDFLKLAG